MKKLLILLLSVISLSLIGMDKHRGSLQAGSSKKNPAPKILSNNDRVLAIAKAEIKVLLDTEKQFLFTWQYVDSLLQNITKIASVSSKEYKYLLNTNVELLNIIKNGISAADAKTVDEKKTIEPTLLLLNGSKRLAYKASLVDHTDPKVRTTYNSLNRLYNRNFTAYENWLKSLLQ